MGLYIYSNPNNESEYVEIVQKMNDEHIYFKDGIKWLRVFTVPQGSIDTKIDCMNPKQFVDITGKKNDTIGGLWDRSRELSEQREKKMGKDTIKEAHDIKAKEKRGGKMLAHEIAANKEKTFEI